jgi:hypothetical protein
MSDHKDERDTDFGGHIRQGLSSARDSLQTFFAAIARVASDLAGFIYYWQWNHKAKFKRVARTLSFAVVVFQSGILLLEALGDYFGAERLVHWLKLLPVSESTRLSFFLGAAVFLAFHYHSEMTKPEHEYHFATRLLTAMSRQREGKDDNATLGIFHALFTRVAVRHVSVYRPTEDKLSLRITAVFPSEKDLSYYQDLPIEKGVAGRVFSDQAPRYAARLFFPIRFRRSKFCVYLPHAQRFVLQQYKEASGRFAFRLIEKKVDAHIFETDDRSKLLFNAFLSVPILHPKTGESLGVLNFDFDKPGRLDAVDVTMASVFGRWFGVEIES